MIVFVFVFVVLMLCLVLVMFGLIGFFVSVVVCVVELFMVSV